jgi:hypothetical protein
MACDFVVMILNGCSEYEQISFRQASLFREPNVFRNSDSDRELERTLYCDAPLSIRRNAAPPEALRMRYGYGYRHGYRWQAVSIRASESCSLDGRGGVGKIPDAGFRP